jgi:hypothetical protein
VSDTVPCASPKSLASDGIVVLELFRVSSLLATAWGQTPLRKCDERSTGRDLDEAVLGQGVDGFAVEVGQRALGFRNQSQRLRSPLPERAFEP